MKQVTFEESRTIQLKILTCFDNWCIEHGLHYSLAGGTLLGAVRHKGFIPWDDDIDVFMLRKDYEKFINSWDGPYNLVTNINNNNFWYDGYSRLTDESTILKWDSGENAFHGIWMAILPIDNFPTDKDWKLFEFQLNLCRAACRLKCCRWNKNIKLYRNIMRIFARTLITPIPLSYITKILNKILSKYNKTETKRKANISTWFMTNHRPQVFDKECFNDYVRLEFEGFYFESMVGYEKYLVSTYGDWKTLPPIEQRIASHHYKAYYKNN